MKTELKSLRDKRGASQIKMANLFNVSLRTYQRYESGERRPGIDTARRIAEALGQTVDEVFPAKQQQS